MACSDFLYWIKGKLSVCNRKITEDYVSHIQDERMQRTQKNLLSPRKMSVSRMHSLPNDSYMFRPVRPASAPYPLQEVEPAQAYLELGICYFSLISGLLTLFCFCLFLKNVTKNLETKRWTNFPYRLSDLDPLTAL